MGERRLRQMSLGVPEDLYLWLERYAHEQAHQVEDEVVEAIRFYLVGKPVEHGRPLYSSE